MTKLNYESRTQQEWTTFQSTVDVFWWFGSGICGAASGYALYVLVFGVFADFPITNAIFLVGTCGVVGGALTMLAAAPLLLLVRTRRRRMLLGALLGFLATGVVLPVLVRLFAV